MNIVRHTIIRVKNAFLYKLGMKFPFSKVRVKAMRALGHDVGADVYFPADLVLTQNFVISRGSSIWAIGFQLAPGVYSFCPLMQMHHG